MKIEEKYKFSEFFDKNPEKSRKIEFLVLHHIEAKSLNAAMSLLKEHQVSSHYIISQNGEICRLVDDCDVAYHAGVSYWRGVEGLNSASIGIEFVSDDVLQRGFSRKQMEAGLALCRELIAKYNIESQNVVGHSDIAYCPQEGCLGRKDDPSHLFDWEFLAQNGVGVWLDIVFGGEILFKLGDKSPEIAEIKRKLADFGYKVTNFGDEFDLEMEFLVKAVNRRFNRVGYERGSGGWWG